MKHYKLFFTLLISFIVSIIMFTETNAQTYVTLPGDFQSELGCADDWDPACTITDLAYNSSTGKWFASFNIPAGDWQYKVAIDHSWDENYGDGGVPGGSNILLSQAVDTQVGFLYDPATHVVTTVYSSSDIYVVNVKSGNTERVTFIDDADEFNPSFSNNGKKVAHDVVGGPAPLGHSIYVTDVKRGESNLLTGAEGGNDASWSPNGKIIAFDRAAVGDPNIYTVPANGGTPTLVRENAVDPEWSNNSKRLVFRDFTDNSVRTVDLNGGSETVVATSGFNPSWSPNGKYIAFTDGDNIFKISVKQSGEPKGIPVQLTNDGANHQPSWSNNSKTIVFHSNRVSGDEDIWTISAYGETPSLLAGLADYGDFDPSYLKNGKYVAYAGFTSVNSSNSQKNETTVSTSRSSVPTQFSLNQNFPNPFNPSTLIQYTIPNASNVKIEIFNITGESVATLVDGFKNEGYYEVSFNASDLPSGMYLYRISAGTFVQTRKMILLR